MWENALVHIAIAASRRCKIENYHKDPILRARINGKKVMSGRNGLRNCVQTLMIFSFYRPKTPVRCNTPLQLRLCSQKASYCAFETKRRPAPLVSCLHRRCWVMGWVDCGVDSGRRRRRQICGSFISVTLALANMYRRTMLKPSQYCNIDHFSSTSSRYVPLTNVN